MPIRRPDDGSSSSWAALPGAALPEARALRSAVGCVSSGLGSGMKAKVRETAGSITGVDVDGKRVYVLGVLGGSDSSVERPSAAAGSRSAAKVWIRSTH